MTGRVGILWLALGAACGGTPRERIVLVTLDTCRSDALVAMPNLTAFAARGTRFTAAYSATSTTKPTHASLLTGLHPWQHGVTQNTEVLPESAVTLAETLAEHGFDTAAVVASFPLGRHSGLTQGFRLFHDEFRMDYAEKSRAESVAGKHFYSLGEAVTDQALALLDELDGPRQFLWVHYFDPHDPYGDAARVERALGIREVLQAAREEQPNVPELVKRARELYTRDVAALDEALGRLIERLARADGFTTHVIVTADHGESLGEQGSIGHGRRLLPVQVRVPLVLVSPRVPAGERADTAGSVDVSTTLLALANLERGNLPGRDLTYAAPEACAYGMRRTFGRPRPEQLLDGRVMQIEGSRFYLARGASLFTGDAASVFQDDDTTQVLPEDKTRELRAVFRGFQAQLDGTSVEALDSAEVREALQALGYGE